MATQIFSDVEDADGHSVNEQAAHRAWCADQTQTVLYDGAGRYAVGHLGQIEDDLDTFMAPDEWEWLEVEEEFYDPDYRSEANGSV